MSFRGSVKNLDRLQDKLKRMPVALQRPITEQLALAVQQMDDYAKARIEADAGTGRVYKRHGVEHVASAPGDYPKEDTGALVASMGWSASGLTASWYASAAHARPLEYGTSKMAARPFMRPTAQLILPRFNSAVRNAIRSALAQFHG
jgi:HK97 gp10 family phage protein